MVVVKVVWKNFDRLPSRLVKYSSGVRRQISGNAVNRHQISERYATLNGGNTTFHRKIHKICMKLKLYIKYIVVLKSMLNTKYSETGCQVYNMKNVFVVPVYMYKVTF